MNNDCHARGQRRGKEGVLRIVAALSVGIPMGGAAVANGDWVIALLVLAGVIYSLQESV